jgi:photosystem II stability/assembly factor-like uncharacterized protein
MPYKDVSVKVLSQDDAYATVEVHAMLRPDAEKPWDEQVRTLQFALVSGQWKVSKTDSFASVAGLATATAQAQIAAATATAGMEARFQSDARGANLSAVHMLSATEGWALGENVMLHYTGGEWVPQRIPDTMPGGRVHGTQGLRDIYMLSANDGWIVGGDPASNGAIEYNVAFILHYDGTQWSTVGELPEAGKGYTLTAIDMVSPTEGWAVGNNTILHYTTASTGGSTGAGGGMGTWEKVKSPGDGNYALYDIKMVSADEGWATGRSGIMLHYKGGTWSQVESNVHDHMYTLAVVSSSDVWALGDYGHTTHYDGTAWTEPNLALNWSNNLQFRGASFSSPADGWAVDKWGGRFLHFSNGKWQELEESLSPKRNNSRAEGLYGIFMLSAEEGWAVGAEGLVLHYIDGKWTEFKR